MIDEALHHRVHVKDLGWTRENGVLTTTFAGPGEGLIDWREFLKLLAGRGYAGWLSIEDYRGGWCRKNPEWPAGRKVREWKAFLETVLGEVGGK